MRVDLFSKSLSLHNFALFKYVTGYVSYITRMKIFRF